jgi:RNA polymerase sigma factor (sigma-70 family)
MDAEIQPVAVVADVGDFDAFYRRWFASVARATALVLRDPDQGQELAQEAFVQLWRRWDRMKSQDHARNFVFRVSLNEARSHLRRRRLELLGLDRERKQTSADATGGVPERMFVLDALGALSLRQRECVVLVDYLGYDASSAGELLGIRPPTVRVQLMRGRARLRERLGERR